MADSGITRSFGHTPDGRRLAYLRRGSAPRLVTFEAGLGASSHYWLPVMRLLPESVTAIAYDRAGIGGSDPDRAPRTLARLADDLGALIADLPHESLVLVGHSWGGPIVHAAAASGIVGEKLIGTVLVDPSDPLLLGEYRPWAIAAQQRLVVTTARLGLLRRLMTPVFDKLPPNDLADALDACASLAAARETAAEFRQFLPELRRLTMPGLDVPTRLISGAQPDQGESDELRRRIHAAHTASAAALGARLVAAERSGHRIPLTEPELIVEVIAELHAVHRP